MVWKLLSGISAACLAVAAYYAFISKNDINTEREGEKRATANLAEVSTRKAVADEKLKQKQEQLVALNLDLEKVKGDVVAAAAEAQEKEAALQLVKTNLEQTSQQLAAVEKKIEEAGDIEKLLAQVNALKKDKEAAESALAAENQQVEQAKERVASLQKQIEVSREAESRSRKGELEPGFTARVAQSFSEWGFTVLNKGNAGGIIANAELDVKRGSDIVAKLKVRNVEQAISVADIVPGSLGQGDAIRAGDLVVAAPVVKKEVAPPSPPPSTERSPAVAPAPAAGADPFAAPGAAPAAAPAMADPFGAPAAAPAPAPAADPFGAPAAPATGAGTQASPSTADPFAKP